MFNPRRFSFSRRHLIPLLQYLKQQCGIQIRYSARSTKAVSTMSLVIDLHLTETQRSKTKQQIKPTDQETTDQALCIGKRLLEWYTWCDCNAREYDKLESNLFSVVSTRWASSVAVAGFQQTPPRSHCHRVQLAAYHIATHCAIQTTGK